MTLQEIENRFTYYPPKELQAQRYGKIREAGKALAEILILECSPSTKTREFSLAMTNLEQAIMWANAAIARNE